VIVIDIVHHDNHSEEHEQNHDDGQNFLQLWEVNEVASPIVRSMIADSLWRVQIHETRRGNKSNHC
jgi:hypothetical protein